MMNLAAFRATAEAAGNPEGAVIRLSSNGSELKVSSGLKTRVKAWLQTSRNQVVAGRFVESLRREYGRDVAQEAIGSSSLERLQERGKPLRVRLVRVIIDEAHRIRANLVDSNREILGNYYRPTERGTATDMLRQMIGEKVSARYPSCSESAKFLDPNRIAQLIKDEIIAAGRDGTHFVTNEEATNLVDEIIKRELDTYARALERLSVGGGNSMTDRALANAAAESLPLWFHPKRLTPGGVDALNLLVKGALAGGRIPREQLDDDGALRGLAQEVAKEYVAERLAGLQEVERLPLDPQVRKVLQKEVVYANMPPELAVTMGEAYPNIRSDLASLGERLDCPKSRDFIVKVGTAIAQALGDARIRHGLENQDAVRNCWHFLLAAGGEQLAGNIAGRVLAEDSPLRAIGEGAKWFLLDFLNAPEAHRNRHPDGEPIYGLPAYCQALMLSKSMDGLAEAAQETAPDGGGPPGFQNRSADRLRDEEVAVLRDLCVPIPAPNRIGQKDHDVPLSESALAAIQNNIGKQGKRTRSLETEDGVVRESLEGLERARLSIDNKRLVPGKDNAVQRLKAICSDEQGILNAELLKQVSSMTSERTFGSVHLACFDSRRPDLAVFAGRPVMTPSQHPDYDLHRDRYGGVALNLVDKRAISQLDFESAGAIVDRSVPMDPDRSFLLIGVTIYIDGATCTPEVQNVVLGYELSPRSTAGEDCGAGKVAPGPAAATGFERPADHIYVAAPGDPGGQPAEVEQMAARVAAQEPRSSALPGTGSNVDNAGAFARSPVAAVDAIPLEKRSKLLLGWQEQVFKLQEQTLMRRSSSRSRARMERAHALENVEGFMQEAIVDLMGRRDPTQALMGHAAELEARQFTDGETGAAEAAKLRKMARDYNESC